MNLGKTNEKIKKGICPMCDKKIIFVDGVPQMRNRISRKEYTISGMCQQCQDEIFGVD